MAQVSNLCCGEGDVSGRAGRSLRQVHPPTPSLLLGDAFQQLLLLVHDGSHRSHACAWLCTSLIQTPTLTRGLAPCPDPLSCLITMGFADWDSGLRWTPTRSLPSSQDGAVGWVPHAPSPGDPLAHAMPTALCMRSSLNFFQGQGQQVSKHSLMLWPAGAK